MGGIRYLYLHTLKNNVRIALRKPVTYVYLAIALMYVVMIPTSFRIMVEEFGVDSPDSMAAVLTLAAFLMVPGNLIAYAKRKGLIYRNSDVHFLFPAPVSPKKILLFAHLKGLFAHACITLFVALCGGFLFHVAAWRLVVYFVFALVVQNFLEGCIMIILYGTERLGEKGRGLVVKAMYGLLLVVAAIGFNSYLQDGLSLESVLGFLNGDAVQLVPIIGWYISVIQLLFMGATTVNVIGTVLYFVFLAVVFTAALRMKCTGSYYEDAIRFAEDYEEVLESRRQGSMEKKLGKKQKFRHTRAFWKGNGASALFYKQLSEYRKSKYFIFDFNSAVAAIAGAFMAYIYVREGSGGLGGLEAYKSFLVPLVSAYLIFIFTNVGGKWAKELQSPYTYLIPDSVWSKMWNATAMQHIQNLMNGCLITIPVAVAMKLGMAETVLCIVFYVVLSANKLYALAVAEVAVGGTLGRVGKQLFQLFVQGIVIMAALAGAVVGNVLGGTVLAYVLMDTFLIVATFVFMVLATLNFYRMEAA